MIDTIIPAQAAFDAAMAEAAYKAAVAPARAAYDAAVAPASASHLAAMAAAFEAAYLS